MQPLITRFNNFRKQKFLNNILFKTSKQYACVGVGMHSLANLYPILNHFRISIKYIYTRSSKWDGQMKQIFPTTRFTHSIEEIINDNDVEGVFICAAPSAHFEILKKLLQTGKKVFVEKPPCQHLSELNQLINIGPGLVCKIGLQRRYWPGNKHVSKRIATAKTYQYAFHFGKYIQGDVYTELFIHAFDYCSFLFGPYKIASFSNHNDNDGITVQLHVLHANGVSGLIDLSTEFSWSAPFDQLVINCKSETITLGYPLQVKSIQKPKHILGLPAERIMNQPLTTKEYFSAGNLLIPAAELNTLVLQGFYDEIKTFVNIVEGRISKNVTQNDLPSMVNTFDILDQLQHSK